MALVRRSRSDSELLKKAKMDAKREFEERRDAILARVPEEYKQMFHQIGFVKWKKELVPCLILSPYDILTSDMRKSCIKVFHNCEKAGRLEHFSFLVYWYGAKSLREAYSYVTKSTLRLSATHREYQKGVTEYENALKKVKTCEQAGKKVPASVQEKAQKYNEMLQDMQTPPEERRGVETTVVKGYDLLTMSDVEETGALGSEMQESDNDDDEEREEIDSSSKKKGVWWKDYKMLPAATVMQRKVSADKSEDPTATLSASARSVSSSPTTAKQSLQRKRPPREDSLDERKPSARPAKRAKNKLSSSTKKPPIVLTKEQEERVNEIREWLTKVGFEPLREEMEVYARKFIVIGFPSVKSIVKLCTKEDIAGFDWINSYHKRWVTAALDQD